MFTNEPTRLIIDILMRDEVLLSCWMKKFVQRMDKEICFLMHDEFFQMLDDEICSVDG
jgi:hypothetical protein